MRKPANPGRNVVWLAVFCLTVGWLTVGCDIHEYVPPAAKLRDPSNPSSAFIHEEHDIQGIYGNLDVDCAIYAYDTATARADEFWNAIDRAAKDDGWTIISDSSPSRKIGRFQRVIPAVGAQEYHSVEEVRIAFCEETQQVIVAWTQADERELPTRFPTEGGEGAFAESVVWPRFESEVAECRSPAHSAD